MLIAKQALINISCYYPCCYIYTCEILDKVKKNCLSFLILKEYVHNIEPHKIVSKLNEIMYVKLLAYSKHSINVKDDFYLEVQMAPQLV